MNASHLPVFEHEIESAAQFASLGSQGVVAAYLEAAGKHTAKEIAEKLAIPPSALLEIRSKPEYKSIYAQALKDITRRGFEGKTDFAEVLDDEILDSIAALVEIRDNVFNAPMARLKASEAILNRAPKAPKPQTVVDERRTILHIPIAQMQAIRQGLNEEGEQDLIELMEGVDYTAEGGVDDVPALPEPRKARVIEFD